MTSKSWNRPVLNIPSLSHSGLGQRQLPQPSRTKPRSSVVCWYLPRTANIQSQGENGTSPPPFLVYTTKINLIINFRSATACLQLWKEVQGITFFWLNVNHNNVKLILEPLWLDIKINTCKTQYMHIIRAVQHHMLVFEKIKERQLNLSNVKRIKKMRSIEIKFILKLRLMIV